MHSGIILPRLYVAAKQLLCYFIVLFVINLFFFKHFIVFNLPLPSFFLQLLLTMAEEKETEEQKQASDDKKDTETNSSNSSPKAKHLSTAAKIKSGLCRVRLLDGTDYETEVDVRITLLSFLVY